MTSPIVTLPRARAGHYGVHGVRQTADLPAREPGSAQLLQLLARLGRSHVTRSHAVCQPGGRRNAVYRRQGGRWRAGTNIWWWVGEFIADMTDILAFFTWKNYQIRYFCTK